MFDFNKPIKMCSRRSCCPTVEFNKDDDFAIIKDDFGGSAKLLVEELDILTNIIYHFKSIKEAENE